MVSQGVDAPLSFPCLCIQALLDKPQPLYALVLSPTRELALQIAEQFEALGASIGVRAATLVGGVDMMAQAIALGRRPHVVVGKQYHTLQLGFRVWWLGSGFWLRFVYSSILKRVYVLKSVVFNTGLNPKP